MIPSAWGRPRRVAAVTTAVLAAGASVIGTASADVIPTQYLTATGTVAAPAYQTYEATSSGTSPVKVDLKLVQTSALGFTIQSTVTDSTAGATISSNNATAEVPDSFSGAVSWTSTDGMTYSGKIAYDMAGSYPVTDEVTDSNGATATVSFTVTTLGSAYTAISPARVLDTRNGTGAATAKVAKGGILKLKIAGAKSIPASGVTAVVMNLTVTNASGAGFITAYPSDDGTSVPNVSNLNYGPGQTIPNSVTVPVGKDGYVYLYNGGSTAGPVDLVADVSGYYEQSTGSLYTPLPDGDIRVLDTRNGTGAPTGAVSNGGTVKLLVAQNDTFLPAPGDLSAVAVNITVTNPSTNGFITAYPGGSSLPNASTVNYAKGQTVANAAIVPVSSDGYIDLTNTMAAAGSADIVVDVSGYFTPGPNAYGGSFVPTAPSRDFDSRADGLGQLQTNVEYLTALGSWAQPTVGIAMNVTMTNPKANGFLTIYPEGASLPTGSNVNWGAGQTVANSAIATANQANGWITVYSGGTNGGPADVVLDVFGYFQSSWNN